MISRVFFFFVIIGFCFSKIYCSVPFDKNLVDTLKIFFHDEYPQCEIGVFGKGYGVYVQSLENAHEISEHPLLSLREINEFLKKSKKNPTFVKVQDFSEPFRLHTLYDWNICLERPRVDGDLRSDVFLG